MNYESLKHVSLFHGIDVSELKSLTVCLGSVYHSYEKGEVVLLAGSPVDQIGIVLSGTVQIIKEDMIGNRSIIGTVGEYELFAEAYACASANILPISVIATEESTIMWIRFQKIVTTCSSSCVFHTKLIANMMKILAEKNQMLNQKIGYLSKRSIRDKLIAYLVAQADRSKSFTFQIPFSRNDLADFLCVDRSSMSRELGKMRDEGLLDFDRNSFRILSKEAFLD